MNRNPDIEEFLSIRTPTGDEGRKAQNIHIAVNLTDKHHREEASFLMVQRLRPLIQEKCGPVLFREGWLVVEGKVQRRGPKALSIIAENLSPLKLG